MTDVQRLRIALQSQQGRVSALLAQDTRTTDEQTELRTLAGTISDLQSQLAAAEASQAVEQAAATPGAPVDAETRERNALRDRVTLGAYLRARLEGRLPGGAEAEYCAAFNSGQGIPLDLFERDRPVQAAVTPAPATGTGVAVAPISPYLFANSIAPRLGISMPSVGSGGHSEMTISTALPAAPQSKGDAATGTAGALTAISTNPRRISARLSLTMEDIASVGATNFEAALRQNTMSSLSDAYDDQCINGDGVAPNVNGLVAQISGNIAATATVETYATILAIAAGPIDGLWASLLSDIRLVVNPETYRYAAKILNSDGAMTAVAYLERELSSFWTNKRMADTVSDVSTGVAYRMGRAGMRTAVHPVWGTLSISDIFSDSASGVQHFSLHVLCGDKVLIVQPDAYTKVQMRVS